MKIGLVTIYKCYNYGSFYQAYGLQKYLEDAGHTVRFLPLDTKYNKNYRLRKLFDRNIKRDLFSLKLCLSYQKDWRLYGIDKPGKKEYDCIVIGSDEIWNIQNRSFTPAEEYYGLNLPVDHVFTYASCVGRSKIENFSEYPQFSDGIKRLKSVSVRDDETKRFYKELTGADNVTRVLDPSFLTDWSTVEKSCREHGFILVYTYDGSWGFCDEYIGKTKEFAKEKGLPLISVGFKNDWCDKSVACSPREFLGYLRNASYVVTDTFHGTAMSIQFNKQFISMGKGKAKVESLLSELGLSDRLYNGQQMLAEITDNMIDYKKINPIIEAKKAVSKRYIEESLNLVKSEKQKI